MGEKNRASTNTVIKVLQKEFGNENNETMKNYGLCLFYSVGISLAVTFEWQPSDGNKNLTKLFLDSNGFYVGGLNTTYFINYNFKDISQRSHSKTTTRHPCCPKSSKTSSNSKEIYFNYAQNILTYGKEDRKRLVICSNINGECTVLKPSDFSNEAKGEKFQDVVSSLRQYPSFARVLSINDSNKETHDILFTAKTNLVGTNTCKQEYKTNKDEKCSCQSRLLDQTWQAVSSNEIMRATEISNTTHKLKDMCGPQAIDSSYEDKMILRQKSISNGINVAPDMCSEEEQNESTTRYIEVFTAYDEYSGTDWLYYIYEFSETKKGTNFEPSKSNFRIGRACVADINFRNIAEIP